MTSDRVIAKNGRIPWDIPADIQLFRQQTINKTVLMGRTTYQSIGHPLPQRNNIVLSRTLAATEGVYISQSFTEGINLAQSFATDIYCIGGAEVYRQALPIADVMHISWVQNNFSGDCFFPRFDQHEWQEISRQQHPGFIYCTYRRKKSNAL